jgi:hypothetical protein
MTRIPARSICVIVGAALLGLPAPADAQTARRSPYVRLFTGIGVTGTSDLRIRQPGRGTDLTFEQVAWEHKSLSTEWTRDSIPYMGARAGFFLRGPRWLAVSAEVVHFKIFAKEEERLRVRGTHRGLPVDTVAPFGRFVQQYQVSNGVNLILGNLEAHRRMGRGVRFPDGRIDVYGGFGAGVTIPYTRSVIDGQSHAEYEFGRLATQLLGGVSWHVTRRWDASLEYKFTATTVDGTVAAGDSRSQLRTHHLVFGVGYHFRQ